MQIELGNRERAIMALEKVTGAQSNSARYFGLKAEALHDEMFGTRALADYEEAIARRSV
jgi:hypothetical protein